MREFTVAAGEAGQRLDKYLKRLLPAAEPSFLYRMLRKKNITRNGAKADGAEHVEEGDVIRLFFSEETFLKFAGEVGGETGEAKENLASYERARESLAGMRIVFETEDVCVLYKPAGILSQKAGAADLSANEWFVGTLLASGKVTARSLAGFTPSVANRLDRNTEGLLLAGKTLKGSRLLSRCLRERTIQKNYQMAVCGVLEKEGLVESYLVKDEKTNTVRLFSSPREGTVPIRTKLSRGPVSKSGKYSLVEADLITGKTHQLRAQLAFLGHPILGDPKYGNAGENRALHLTRQLLICSRVVFPDLPEEPSLSGRVVEIPLPSVYTRVLGE
ncbi:MAG: RluA family pseudouridine synthase [Lachnospiraceae bacterium]